MLPDQYANAAARLEVIKDRAEMFMNRCSIVAKHAMILKDGGEAAGPDVSDVHVPAPLGTVPAKKPKKKVATDGK